MNEALFKDVRYKLRSLVDQIKIGELGLPDIQRPFVWTNAKVRDLFDSMYRGYPVGFLLFWQTGLEATESRSIGEDNKQKLPSLLIVDGQQRLTSLYAVIQKEAVLREDFCREHIRIAFRPQDESFSLPSAITESDPEYIPDISEVFQHSSYEVISNYLTGLRSHREVTKDEERNIANAIDRLAKIADYNFIALEISSQCSEEQVADVFVRINSEGKKLNQSDFILTLMSVFWDDGRRCLEAFCRAAREPSTLGALTPFNHIFQPEPVHLLRVSAGIAFKRSKLEHVYSLLRGKDLATGESNSEKRDIQFNKLRDAQSRVLNLTYWADFLNVVRAAGYRNANHISSINALVFSYQLYLLGRTEYGVDNFNLKKSIARWLYMSLLTGRYTGATESKMEQDLAELRGIKSANEFSERLSAVEAATLTNDYWNKTLPLELSISSGRSPALFAFYAAQVLLDAPALFSEAKVSDLLDPPSTGRKKPIERHHLFPKRFLKKIGKEGAREINQIANYALVEWGDNLAISDDPPSQYWHKYSSRFSPDAINKMIKLHALPDNWWAMSYDDFLAARRLLMANIIRQGYEKLCEGGPLL